MTLTPLDIHNKEFSRSFRGYNKDEVNEFLDRVVKDYESVIKKNMELKEEVEKLNNKIEHYQKMEETLHNAIVVAQETAEEVKENSNKEAELIKKEAESEAQKMIDDANNQVKQIEHEIMELKKQANTYRAKFKSLIESQLDMLQNDEWRDFQLASSDEGEESRENNTEQSGEAHQQEEDKEQ